jgi:carboxypeptidase C (cathepsin A)
MGLFLQAGPCSITAGDNNTSSNAHSWTNFANIIFIEWVATLDATNKTWELVTDG